MVLRRPARSWSRAVGARASGRRSVRWCRWRRPSRAGSPGAARRMPLLVLLAGAGGVSAGLPGRPWRRHAPARASAVALFCFGDLCAAGLAFAVQGTHGVAGTLPGARRARRLRLHRGLGRAVARASAVSSRRRARGDLAGRAGSVLGLLSSWAAWLGAGRPRPGLGRPQGRLAVASRACEDGGAVDAGAELRAGGRSRRWRRRGRPRPGRGPRCRLTPRAGRSAADGAGTRATRCAGPAPACRPRGLRGLPARSSRAGDPARPGPCPGPGRRIRGTGMCPARRLPASPQRLRSGSQSSSRLSFLLAVPGHGGTKRSKTQRDEMDRDE